MPTAAPEAKPIISETVPAYMGLSSLQPPPYKSNAPRCSPRENTFPLSPGAAKSAPAYAPLPQAGRPPYPCRAPLPETGLPPGSPATPPFPCLRRKRSLRRCLCQAQKTLSPHTPNRCKYPWHRHSLSCTMPPPPRVRSSYIGNTRTGCIPYTECSLCCSIICT